MTQPVPVPDTVQKSCPPLGHQRTEVRPSHMESEHKRYVRNRDAVSRQIEGELVIVPIRRGVGDLNSLYTLNPVGAVLWDFLTEGHTLPEMVQRVCDEFEVTSQQAQSDIQEFLGSLVEEKLVQSIT